MPQWLICTRLASCNFWRKTVAWCFANSQTGQCRRQGSLLSISSKTTITNTPFTNYEEERKNFNLKVPEYYNFSRDVIDKWAELEQTGGRCGNPAFWWVDTTGKEIKWNFQNLSINSQRVANMLMGPCRLARGDKMMIILMKIPQWWLLSLASIRAGIVLCSGTPLLRPRDIKHRLLTSQTQCIVADTSSMDTVEQIAQDCPDLKTKVFIGPKSETRPGWLNFEDLFVKAHSEFKCANTKASDPMMLFFTSGTTGNPKITEHSQASYGLGHTVTARYGLMATKDDIVWNLSDVGWAKSAWSNLFAPWIAGACVFIQHTEDIRFDPGLVLRNLEKHPISVFCASATAMQIMVKLKQRIHPLRLRHTVSGGEPITLLCANYPCIDIKPGSMGKATPGTDLQIVDDSGNIMAPGVEGNVGVRCRPTKPVGLFTKYLNDTEQTESVFRGDFYLTGDRAVMDEENYFWFVGRSDDVIISAGYRIGPFEVESALNEHPSVLESAVVGSPDQIRGEIVKAFVILNQDYLDTNRDVLAKEIQEHMKAITAPYKYPRKIEFVKNLPKTVSGKIKRFELRNKEWKAERETVVSE